MEMIPANETANDYIGRCFPKIRSAADWAKQPMFKESGPCLNCTIAVVRGESTKLCWASRTDPNTCWNCVDSGQKCIDFPGKKQGYSRRLRRTAVSLMYNLGTGDKKGVDEDSAELRKELWIADAEIGEREEPAVPAAANDDGAQRRLTQDILRELEHLGGLKQLVRMLGEGILARLRQTPELQLIVRLLGELDDVGGFGRVADRLER